MKKFLFTVAFVAVFATTACSNDQSVNPLVEDENTSATTEGKEVPFEVARNYFFRNDRSAPSDPKILTEEDFNNLFGMATTMGEAGKPTEIDFSRQFVVAVVMPVTDVATEITPEKMVERDGVLHYRYTVALGEKLTYTIRPLSIVIVDRKYADCEVVLEP